MHRFRYVSFTGKGLNRFITLYTPDPAIYFNPLSYLQNSDQQFISVLP